MPAHVSRLLIASWLLVLPLSGCHCEDERDTAQPWTLGEPPDPNAPVDMADAAPDLPRDTPPDLPEDMAPEDMGQDLGQDLGRDMDIVIPPEIPWEREVVEEVTEEQALTDRTSLGVGDDGIIWLGYHSCGADLRCTNPQLAVARREPRSAGWAKEQVTPQSGTFGLDVWGTQPFVAYLDDRNREFRVGRRGANGQWSLRALDVTYTGIYDGLDITHDGQRVYVTFANDISDPVALFALDMTRAGADWFKLQSLDVGPASAALERGLHADGNGNLFLVHRAGDIDPYGVARFRLQDNLWDRNTYFSNAQQIVSSMVAIPNGDLCIASTLDGVVTVSCGTIRDLERQVEPLANERTTTYSSMIRGRDGSLILAYNYRQNEALRVARRYPNGQWDIRTVFDGPSYGVSTAIDTENKLVISYYTCRQQRCTLEVLRQPYQ